MGQRRVPSPIAIPMPPAQTRSRSTAMLSISSSPAMVKRDRPETTGTIESRPRPLKLLSVPALRAAESCNSQLDFRPAVRENEASTRERLTGESHDRQIDHCHSLRSGRTGGGSPFVSSRAGDGRREVCDSGRPAAAGCRRSSRKGVFGFRGRELDLLRDLRRRRKELSTAEQDRGCGRDVARNATRPADRCLGKDGCCRRSRR